MVLILCFFFFINPFTIINQVDAALIELDPTFDDYYFEKAYRYNIQGWVYLHLEGGPFERGYQYGYLAAPEIIDMIQRWINVGHSFNFMKLFLYKNLPQNYDKLSQQWWNICRTKSMKLFYEQIPKEYQDELRGMTEGLKARGAKIYGRNIEFEDIVASQFAQELQYVIQHPLKKTHLIRGIFNGLKDILTDGIKPTHDGHCIAFIAAGDATKDGGIVVAHSTIFSNYIAERCNFIVDIQPTEGYRFIMAGPPGSIWSQEDWYQNEKGIVLTETEIPSQGPYKLKGTLPKGVRSRTAIQYSDSIDEVIDNLQKGNNGLIPNEWLIGDTKTGEIASLEQAYYNTPIKRTFNGFYWSCCTPHDKSVKREVFNLKNWGLDLTKKIAPNLINGSYDRYVNEFNRIEQDCYGQIDIQFAKEIFGLESMSDLTTDGKITDTKNMEELGFYAFMGNPGGRELIPSNHQKNKFKDITELPPNNWVRLFPSTSRNEDIISQVNNNQKNQNYKLLSTKTITEDDKNKYISTGLDDDLLSGQKVNSLLYGTTNLPFASTSYLSNIIEDKIFINNDKTCYCFDLETEEIVWIFETDRIITTSPKIHNTDVYIGSWDGNLYKLDKKNGEIKWKYQTGWGIETIPAINNGIVYFGSTDNNFYALNEETGELEWYFPCESAIHSSPTVYGEYVFFGSDDGRLYALNKTTGQQAWNFAPGYTVTKDNVNNYITTPILSDPIVIDGKVYVGVKGNVYALNAQTQEENKNIEQKISSKDDIVFIMLIAMVLLVLLVIYVIYLKKKE